MPQQGQSGLLGGPPPSTPQQQEPDVSGALMAIAQHLKINPKQFRSPDEFLNAIVKAAPMPEVLAIVDAMAKKLGIQSPAAAVQQPPQQGMPQQGAMPQQAAPQQGLLG